MGVSRIFLSHSHQDNDWCSAFVEELKRYGLDIWFDKQSLYVGAKWLQTIEIELEGRDTFLVVLTPASWSSSWVRDELVLALAQHKRIVSVLHQPTQVSGFITNYQMLNVIGLNSIEAAQAVAAALGLSHSKWLATSAEASVEQPTLPPPLEPAARTEGQSTNEEYEYFEITKHSASWVFFTFQITNIASKQTLYRQNFVDDKSAEAASREQKAIAKLREYAKANGLEELPEKGAHWYSYRFRRKKK